MLSRKQFIKRGYLATGAILAGPLLNHAAEWDRPQRLTILHTNDTHSRLDPFPMDGSRNQGLGGVAARAAHINRIRQEEEHVLLFDAGDIFQGTPYFNLYKGEPEIKAMTAMGYDATAIGNHDFDAGMENLATQLKLHANFPMLVCNYGLQETPLEGLLKPWQVFKRGKLRIGVLGVSIEGKGLIPDNLFGKTIYRDPIADANATAAYLKKEQDCDLVICLSHLGYKFSGEPKVSDEILARESEHIDLIIGGHTHTFLDRPSIFTNRKGQEVLVNQVGFAGINLGRIDFEFSKFSGRKMVKTEKIIISEKSTL